MFSRGLYFLLCSLIFQFEAVARKSFFKFRVLSMNLYLLVKELERKRCIKQALLDDAWTSNLIVEVSHKLITVFLTVIFAVQLSFKIIMKYLATILLEGFFTLQATKTSTRKARNLR